MVRESKVPHFKPERAVSINSPWYFRRKVSEGIKLTFGSEQTLTSCRGISVGGTDNRVISVGVWNLTYLKAESYWISSKPTSSLRKVISNRR